MSGQKVTVVSHDAGGAEILASFVARNALDCYFVLAGPALGVFERRLGREVTLSMLEKAMDSSTKVLAGTGSESDLEYSAICMAKRKGIPTEVFLDHWVNYASRFTRAGVTCLPDRILVGDTHALRIAEDLFPEVPIVLEENPYFLDIQDQARDAKPRTIQEGEPVRILYLAEPIDCHRGFTEWERIDFLLRQLSASENRNFSLTIRPHPRENERKYEPFRQIYPFVEPWIPSSLFSQIIRSDVVVGLETQAMAVAVKCGKPVFSSLPPEALPCQIPLPEIKPLPVDVESILKIRSPQ